MLFESQAVVLKAIRRREDDLLCDLLTEERGRFWGVAQRALKSRKRFGTVLTPLNILRVSFEERDPSALAAPAAPAFLREAEVAVPLVHLRENFVRIGTAFYLVEAVRELTPERATEPRKFRLLSESLQALDRGEDPARVKMNFEETLLTLSGLKPHLANCLRCGAEEKRYYFVFREGGCFCRRCLPAGAPFETVERESAGWLFGAFLEYCIGKKLRSTKLCSFAS